MPAKGGSEAVMLARLLDGVLIENEVRDEILDMGAVAVHQNPANSSYLALTIYEPVEGISEPSVELNPARALRLAAALMDWARKQ